MTSESVSLDSVLHNPTTQVKASGSPHLPVPAAPPDSATDSLPPAANPACSSHDNPDALARADQTPKRGAGAIDDSCNTIGSEALVPGSHMRRKFRIVQHVPTEALSTNVFPAPILPDLFGANVGDVDLPSSGTRVDVGGNHTEPAGDVDKIEEAPPPIYVNKHGDG